MICRWDKKAENCPTSPIAAAVFKATKVKSSRFSQDRVQKMLETVDRVGAKITNTTRKLLIFRGEFDSIDMMDPATGPNTTRDLNDDSNLFDNLFKVL